MTAKELGDRLTLKLTRALLRAWWYGLTVGMWRGEQRVIVATRDRITAIYYARFDLCPEAPGGVRATVKKVFFKA